MFVKYLRDIVLLTTKKRLQRVILPFAGDQKIDKTFESIRKGKVEKATDLISLGIIEEDNSKSSTRFKKKCELAGVNAVLLISDHGLTTSQARFKEVWKYYACARILIAFGKRDSGAYYCEKVFKSAIKYGWLDIALSSCKRLRYHHATATGDEKKYNFYKEEYKKLKEIKDAEDLVEGLFLDISRLFVTNKSTDEKIIKTLTWEIEQVENLIYKYQTKWIGLLGFNYICLSHQIKNDPVNVLKVCDKAIQYFKDKPKTVATLLTFNFKKVPYCLQLGQFKEAKALIDYIETICNKGDPNHMHLLQYGVMLGFHSGEYELCYKYLKEARKYLNYTSIQIKEVWGIIEGYVLAFAELGLIKTDNVEKFRLGKFLNEVPTYSRDKAGHNTNILILQVLFYLIRGKIDKIHDGSAAINIYAYRYLKGNHVKRARTFLKMILQISPGYFNRIAVSRKAAIYIKELKNNPIRWAMESTEIEIVPYELLWKQMLTLLDGK